MTSSIEITHINAPDDVPFERLVEILLAAFAFQDDIVDPPSSAKSVSVSELQWRFARDTLFVARDGNGNIIGQIWIEDVGKDAYLYKLSVDPAVKGAGIGKALVEAALAFARDRGKQHMRLSVRIELEDNIAFFKSRGFEIVGEGVHDGYDRTTFWKMACDLRQI
ncbi:MAG: GNAT family N-acetyltransferase [Thalassospira sp.]|uniref:GNAT family N-acetyltransferase n=1 Tax=Thalassospira sp. TaxID=1912094 RepID=UPI001B23D318|nr:GNAT family N-acetyltransferase [Thalassospira sp.]MBO6579236.1 GNAT family N-acetyltransferase [Thalassospira sp.]MBO6801852.1 GNAT family N-acetyltransferase [Thalassospira sp.]MBO6818305.1 GNAT family N-acetyltransferase [Thalassospira sp.]MBO6888188.1 GNAT family N-acetyltransferase [Thalassospira sp.]